MGETATLHRAYQGYEKLAAASQGIDFTKIRAHGTKACPDVSKNTEVLKGPPDRIVEELKSTDLDLGQRRVTI